MLKRILSFIIAFSLSVTFLLSAVGCDEKDNGKENIDPDFSQDGEGDKDPKDDIVGTGACDYLLTRSTDGHSLKFVKMTVKGHGSMILLLDETAAPLTVKNFIKLADEGFYDGLTFHRVKTNFMIQGGDPKADGSGNSSESIKGEFAANGYYGNDISHKEGVISMARSNHPNSASCQFFICNTDYMNLDGYYASFGYVIAGLSVIQSITDATYKYGDANGTISNKSKQAVISSVKVLPTEDALQEAGVTTLKAPYADSSRYFGQRDTEGHELKYVKMSVKDHGDIILLLDGTTAPLTVANFVKLTEEGFYNGLTFHRVIQDFMIQGGDPKADGTGNSSESIKGEFAANGYSGNDISHINGVISMARGGYSMDSASCQFFICNTDYPYLDGSYAAFGYVISGMSVVQSITSATYKHGNESGTIEDKSKQAVITSAEVISEEEALGYVKTN